MKTWFITGGTPGGFGLTYAEAALDLGDRVVVTPSVSTPRSSSCRDGWGELLSDSAVAGGVVGLLIDPAAPDDAYPGAGQDPDCVGVVLAAGARVVVDVGGPGALVAAVVGECRDGAAEAFVAGPAEVDGALLARFLALHKRGCRGGVSGIGASVRG